MKKIITLLSITFYIFYPTYSQKYVILQTNITSSLDTTARDSIILKPGFEFSLTGGDSLCLNIDEQIIDSVAYDYSNNLPDQNRLLDQSLEVGTTNGFFSVGISGTAQYTIPLDLPPGVRGMKPNLSIMYNQSGPGLLGYGFNLVGLSQISYTYPTKYNDDTYGSSISKYILSLNGQRLIKTQIGGQDYYQTEYDSKVIIEELSSPIKHFQQFNPDGSTINYGETSNSQLSASSGSWAFYITSIADIKGNKIKYNYVDKDDNNSQVLIDKIEYYLAGASTPYASIVFCYDDEIVEGDTKARYGKLINYDHLIRKIKIFSGLNLQMEYCFYYTKFQESSSSNPEQIYSYLYKIEEKDASGNTYNPIVFAWCEQPVDSQDSLLVLLRYDSGGIEPEWLDRKYYPGDIDGDGIMELVGDTLPNTRGGSSPDGHSIDIFDDLSWKKVARPSGYKSFILGDFNGDSKDEILWYYGERSTSSRQYHKGNKKSSGTNLTDTEFLILQWNGTTFVRKDTVNPTSINDDIKDLFVGDVNGDLLDDIIAITDNNGMYIFKGNYTGWINNNHDYYLSLPHDGDVYIGDFNGDGKSDILHVNQYNAYCYYLDSTESISTYFIQDIVIENDDFIIGDMNNDGISDLAFNGRDSIYYGTGDGFILQAQSTSVNLADLNNDYKSDTIEYDDVNEISVLEINSMFGKEKYFQSAMYNSRVRQLLIHDFNGDGISDVFAYWDDVLTYNTLSSIAEEWGNSAIGFDDEGLDQHIPNPVMIGGLMVRPSSYTPLLLKTITDGLNNTTKINYELLTEQSAYTKNHTGDTSFYNLIAPIPIVSSYSQNDGIGGINAYGFAYEDAVTHRKGKGFLGFSKVTSVDSARSIKTEKYFDQDIILSGGTQIIFSHIDSILTKTTTGTRINLLVNQHNAYKYNNTMHCFPFIEQAINTDHLTDQTIYNRFHYTEKNSSGFKYSELTSSAKDFGVSKDSIRNTFILNLNLSLDRYILTKTEDKLIKTRSALSGQKKVYTTSYQYLTNSSLLSSVITEPNVSSLKRIKAYQYDIYGNPTRVVDSVPNSTGRYLTYKYDDTKRFITETDNNLGHTTTASYDNFGFLTSKTDLNGLLTSYAYGSFNRLISFKSPDSTQAFSNSYSWVTPGSGSAPNLSVYKVVTSKPAQTPVITYFDKLGREIRTVYSGFSGESIYIDTKYNTKGQADSVSLPYESGNNWIRNFFDPYGRKTQQIKLSDTTSWSYNGLSITETIYGVSSTKTYGNDGLISSVQDASNPQVSFTYNIAGLDSIITAPGSIQTKIEYDHYGRKTKLIDPDAGTMKYYYNGFGDLTAQINASDDSTAMTYDNLGRLTQKTEIDGDGSNPNKTITITYDTINGKGLVNRITVSDEISEKYNYDDLSRVSSRSVTIYGEASPFTEVYNYDEYSRLETLTYPSGFKVVHDYNSYGYLNKITRNDNSEVIWEAKDYNELGLPEEIWLNNSSEKTYYEYNNDYLLSEIRTSRSWNIQYLKYTWNGSRHLLASREDERIDKTETFTYDGLNRLRKWAISGETPDSIVYTTDYSGGINSKTGIGTYNYNSSYAPPHTLYELTNIGSLVDTACHEIEYTAFLKTKTLIHTHNQDSIVFSYGDGNQRYKKRIYDGSLISTTIYSHDNYEVITAGSTTRKLHYINTPSGLSAIYVDNSTTANDTMYFIHKDHIGSFDLITNDQDTSKSYLSFDPWGKRRHPSNWDYDDVPTNYIFERGFTGHEHIDHFGLINMNGRMYDPALGMMLGPDNFVSQPFNTQNYDRYSYALNNPLIYTDPTGNYVRQFEWERQGGGSNYDFDDNTDLYGNPIMPPGGYIAGFMSNSAGNFSSGPSYNEYMASTGNVFLTNQYGLGAWVSGTDIRSFTGQYAWLDAMMYYNSLFPKEHFTNYYSNQDNWNFSLMAFGGDGDGERKFHIGISHDINLSMGPLGGTFEHGDIFSMPGNYHTYGHTLGYELSYSLNLVIMITKPNFQEKNFFGGAAELDFSIPVLPWSSLAFGGDNTSNLYNYLTNKPLNSYTIIKFGIGFGGGVSLTPNSRTKRNYFFYGDPSPGRVYWNPTSR